MPKIFFIGVLACVLVTQPARAVDSGTGQGRQELWNFASAALRAVLVQKYPQVTRWTLAPQFGSAHRRAFPDGLPVSAEVLHTGVRSAVRLIWREANSTQQTRSLWFEVIGEEPAVVLQRARASGAALTSADVTIAPRNVVQFSCSPATSAELLNGMRARRALRAGSVVCLEAIEMRPPVARGEKVKVRYVSDRVLLAATGIAQEDAQIGQRLRVLNPASRESFHAVVSAAAEVIVDE